MNKLNISNVRFGFATNSSSTHSLIFMDDTPQDDIEGYEFGWDHFTAATEHTKRIYCALTLAENLRIYNNLPDSMVDAIVSSWAGVDIKSKDNNGYNRSCGYVDHQSIYCFPKDWEGKGIDKEFYDEFMKIILDPRLVILGGNDNEAFDHPLIGQDNSQIFTLDIDKNPSDMVVRKDTEYNYWLLFDRKTGTKVRLGFDLLCTSPERASVPELVDIGIGTLCNKGCSFCYTGANENGKTSSIENLYDIIYALGELKVPEIALGQMEPTLHPDFENILSKCKYNNIIPNFTTRDTNWLRNDKIRSNVIDMVGGFAFSVSSAKDLKEFINIMEYHCVPKHKVSIQCVMGTINKYELTEILQIAKEECIQITLLGFKSTHRGENYKQIKYDNMFEEVIMPIKKKGMCPRLSIDTTLAKEWEVSLVNSGVPKVLYTTQEGKFSCYIDATNMMIGSSSYCDQSKMYKLGTGNRYMLAGEIKSQFAKL